MNNDQGKPHDPSETSSTTCLGAVGIFWFLTPTDILPESVPLAEGEDDGEFINGPVGHYEYWENLKLQVSALTGIEYDRVPRGRVVFIKKNHEFIVYGSHRTINDKSKRAIVIDAFSLRSSQVSFMQDRHYEIDTAINNKG